MFKYSLCQQALFIRILTGRLGSQYSMAADFGHFSPYFVLLWENSRDDPYFFHLQFKDHNFFVISDTNLLKIGQYFFIFILYFVSWNFTIYHKSIFLKANFSYLEVTIEDNSGHTWKGIFIILKLYVYTRFTSFYCGEKCDFS